MMIRVGSQNVDMKDLTWSVEKDLTCVLTTSARRNSSLLF